jgi:hypothetical protein
MAEKAGRGRKSATVHTLPTRKAAGAGGAKRSGKPTNRLKPSAPPSAALTQEQIDNQARKAQIERVAALTNQHRLMDNKIEAVRLTLNELNGEKKLVRTSIQNSGIRLDVFDERYEKLKLKTKRTDLAAIERERAICSEAMGLFVGEQAEMDFAKLPEGVKPAVHWRAIGYQAGVAGESCDPVEAGCPPEATQEYNKGWGEGQTVIASGMKILATDKKDAAKKAAPANDAKAKAADKKPPAEPAPEPEASTQPDWSGFDNDPANWSAQQRTIFRDWFDGLDPELEIDIEHAGVECAFDRVNDGVDAFTGEAPSAASA